MKRLFDVSLALILTLFLLPVLIVVAMLVWLLLGSPILFVQYRPGLLGHPFRIFKFRTMLDARDDNGNLLLDHERIVPFGCFLRSLSIDELPELFNVIRGDMSLVGPRPLLMEYLEYYTPEQARRHDVKPGVTGWAQVNGRNAISWEEKFELDVWYVDNRSLWLDCKILLQTLVKVCMREGISQEGQATMTKFMGTNTDA